MQKMTDTPKQKCESCGGKLDRLISPTGFQLKGTGWYKTDYAAKPAGGRDKSGQAEKSDKSDPSKKSDPSDKSDQSDKSDKSGQKDKKD
jgi:predicted nucleic acid-binding Zn ribbon protein